MNKRVLLFLIFLSSILPLTTHASFEQNLHIGMRHNEDVKALQHFLTDQGYYDGPINGSFLSGTRNAVELFQEDMNIHPTSGFFGSHSRQVANALLDQMTSARTDTVQTLDTSEGTTTASSSVAIAQIMDTVVTLSDVASTTQNLAQIIQDLQSQSSNTQDQLNQIDAVLNSIIVTLTALQSAPVSSGAPQTSTHVTSVIASTTLLKSIPLSVPFPLLATTTQLQKRH